MIATGAEGGMRKHDGEGNTKRCIFQSQIQTKKRQDHLVAFYYAILRVTALCY